MINSLELILIDVNLLGIKINVKNRTSTDI